MPPRPKSHISRPVIKRLLLAAGAYRMNQKVDIWINEYVKREINHIVRQCSVIAEHSNKKTLSAEHLAMVLETDGIKAYNTNR